MRVTLADLLPALKDRWYLALIVALPLSWPGTWFAGSLEDQYESYAVLALSPEPETDGSSDLVRLEVPRYAVYMASPEALRKAAATVRQDRNEFEKTVDITTPPDSGTIRVAVRSTSPATAARGANALVELGAEQAEREPLLNAFIAARAVPGVAPVGPARPMIVAVSLVSAVLLGCGLVLLLERVRPRVRTQGTLQRQVQPLPVLGEVRPRRRWPLSVGYPRVDSYALVGRRIAAMLPLDHPGAVLAETSAGAGSGPVAVHLAEVLAAGGARVVLLDGRRGAGPQLQAPTGAADGAPRQAGQAIDRAQASPSGQRIDLVVAEPGCSLRDAVSRAVDDDQGGQAPLRSSSGELQHVVVVDAATVLSEAAVEALPNGLPLILVVARKSSVTVVHEALTTAAALDAEVVACVLGRVDAAPARVNSVRSVARVRRRSELQAERS